MKIITESIVDKLKILAAATQKEAQDWISLNAREYGDMMRAVTIGELEHTSEGYSITVFVDPSKLYNKRPRLKNSTNKYPIYVHQGTRRKKARPYLLIGYTIARRNLPKGFILPKIRIENDNK